MSINITSKYIFTTTLRTHVSTTTTVVSLQLIYLYY